MKEITVISDMNSYEVYIDENVQHFRTVLERHIIENSTKIFIVTDDIVYSSHKKELENILIGYDFKVFVMNHGEEHKSYDTVKAIYELLIENHGDRHSILIALGGGIVGDLTGYVAATFMRGVKYINIPTTLMSMVDSSIGGKVAYNFQGIKNLIGTFYNPDFIFISIDFLKTLSKHEFINGLAEIIKHGLIKDRKLLTYLLENLREIIGLDKNKLFHVVTQCVEIKNEVVKIDYKDTGFRNILNFGHTIGHGIEIISNHSVAHGYAVALGILVELKISEYVLGLDKEVYNLIETLFITIGFPTKYKVDNMDLFMYAINHDKKNTNNNINFSLLKDVEKPITKIVVNEDIIKRAIRESIERR